MQYTKNINSSGYSIIAAVMMIGFLLVLTTSTLNLVIQEMQDGKGRQDYMKAYAGAEGAMELALLKIKEEGYGYDYDTVSGDGIYELLQEGNNNSHINYEFESKVSVYSGTLDAYATDIIPLFFIDTTSTKQGISTIDFQGNSDITWNILGNNGGISGKGNFDEFTNVDIKSLQTGSATVQFDKHQKINTFLGNENYLILYNPGSTQLDYIVQSNQEFTLPRAIIYSTSKVGKYAQNLKTQVDNTKFLGILKYSVYSGN